MVTAPVVKLHGSLALLQLLKTLLPVAAPEADTAGPFLFTEASPPILEPNLERGICIPVIYTCMCPVLGVCLVTHKRKTQAYAIHARNDICACLLSGMQNTPGFGPP